MKFPFEIKSISVLRTYGTDKVVFHFEGPTTYPEMAAANPGEDYSPTFQIQTRRGYAEEWLKNAGIEGEVPISVINAPG